MSRTARLLVSIVAAFTLPASCVLAVGFQLGDSKDALKLEYDVSVYDHDTGRVTFKFRLFETGRLGPNTSVDLVIRSKEKHHGGGYKADLTMPLALRKEGTGQVGRIHIRKDWAERAEIRIKTNQLDGKQEPLTWYYHSAPLRDLMGRARPHETVD